MRKGDGFEFTCWFDNDEPIPLKYGTATMQEMCGPIVIYYPHDPSNTADMMHMGKDGQQQRQDGTWYTPEF